MSDETELTSADAQRLLLDLVGEQNNDRGRVLRRFGDLGGNFARWELQDWFALLDAISHAMSWRVAPENTRVLRQLRDRLIPLVQ